MLDLKNKWKQVLDLLKSREEIPSESYNAWVLPLVPSGIEENKLTLLSPHGFTSVSLNRYKEPITKALTEVFKEPVTYEIIQDKTLAEFYEKEQKKQKKAERKKAETAFADGKYDHLKQMQSDCNLNTKYTFDNFIVGNANKFAFGAAKGVAEGKMNDKYNPLFIYGGSGLGKTHLLYAIGNYILSKRRLKVRYVTTEYFLNDLLENLYHGVEKDTFSKGAEKNKRMTKFRQKYRDVDVLLIDDIQFVSGKTRTEEELFNIFDALHQAGRQIVLTSDRMPSEIPGISERLKTRFEWGLMVDVGVPDLETRMAIVKQLVEQEGSIGLSLEVIEFLASVYKNNIRELEGGFNKVCAYCALCGEEPTLETVKKAINYDAVQKQVTADTIVAEVAKFYDMKADDIKGSSRVGKVAHARKVAIYVIRELTGNSWQSIGASLGGRKHTTVMYLYNDTKDDAQKDVKLSGEINTLFNIINQI